MDSLILALEEHKSKSKPQPVTSITRIIHLRERRAGGGFRDAVRGRRLIVSPCGPPASHPGLIYKCLVMRLFLHFSTGIHQTGRGPNLGRFVIFFFFFFGGGAKTKHGHQLLKETKWITRAECCWANNDSNMDLNFLWYKSVRTKSYPINYWRLNGNKYIKSIKALISFTICTFERNGGGISSDT